MIAQVIATEFVRELREQIGTDNLMAAAALNKREPNPGICHMHDYCDADIAMHNAFVRVMGRPPAFLGDEDNEARNDADLELFDEAWALAMKLLEQEFR